MIPRHLVRHSEASKADVGAIRHRRTAAEGTGIWHRKGCVVSVKGGPEEDGCMDQHSSRTASLRHYPGPVHDQGINVSITTALLVDKLVQLRARPYPHRERWLMP